MQPVVNPLIEKEGSEISLRLALVNKLKGIFADSDSIFATEARYGAGDRRADFLVLNENAYAFEIKSDFDSLNRLDYQIADYSCTFDYVSVVTTRRHIQKVRKSTSRKTGLWLYEAGELMQVREASKNARLSRLHLSSGCSRDGLLRALSEARATDSLEVLKEKAIKCMKVTDLRKLFHTELVRRYSATSDSFMQETDGSLLAEDLLLLRRACRIAA